MTGFSFDDLRRAPATEGPNLLAHDATDRLLLDLAAERLADAAPGEVVVLGDRFGALTLGAAALHGASGIRTHQDALSGERALAANAERVGLVDRFSSLPLGAELLDGARLVLLQLPRALAELDELVDLVATHADPTVVLFAGGRVKHMTHAMNAVLARRFGRVDVTHARQKSRVLVASGLLPDAAGHGSGAGVGDGAAAWPRCEHDADLRITVCAHGGAFAGSRVDLGTRLLLGVLGGAVPSATSAIDLGCGTGVLAVALAAARPGLTVVASDDSAAAVASARATAAANGVAERVHVVRDVGLAAQPAASTDLVVLNPPFHAGAAVHDGLARELFAEAARVLRPGGELWAVWNSHLRYRATLETVVGPTRQVARDARFTVTASTRPLSARAALS